MMNPRRPPTDSLENQPLLLPRDVPVRVASWTGWLFLAVFVAAIVFACTVPLPETVVASFVLESRNEGDPMVKLTVGESGFVRLKPGQEVRLRYNAYPYQRYGAAAAKLESISPAAVVTAEGSGLAGTASLQPGPAGHAIEPRPGMRGDARIIIGRRTLLRQFLKSLSSKPRAPERSVP